MIVWIASYPRSGNTFYRILLHHLYDIRTYSIYNDGLFETLSASETIGHELLPAPIEELNAREEIYFVKTHTDPPDDNPAIYIVRDGRDVVVSLAWYSMTFGSPEKLKDKSFRQFLWDIITASEGNDSWSRHVLRWAETGAIFVRYEDLIREPNACLRTNLCSLGLELRQSKQDFPAFEELHNKWPLFFRRGEIGAWRDEMPDDLHELFWDHHAKAMDYFGYKR